jgi:hypothetical protein
LKVVKSLLDAGIQLKTVRGAFLDAAESISSGSDYRRVMTGLLR